MKPQSKNRRIIVRLLYILSAVIVLLIVSSLAAHQYLVNNAGTRIYTGISDVPNTRVALVLGAGVRPDGSLSTLLRDRVDTAVDLYKSGKVAKLLMSGDNRTMHYNEPDHMRKYAIKCGVSAEDVVCDYAGRRTYDSIYRAKHIFGLDRIIIVSQKFHLPRAMFLSDNIGVESFGMSADKPYHRNNKAETREIAACLGAMIDIYINHPKPVMGKKERI